MALTSDGEVKVRDFILFVVRRLVPVLRSGNIVVLDNINMHKNPSLIDAIEKVGASILCRPRYSPDMNRIEVVWAKAKHWVRTLRPTTVPELKSAVRRVLCCIRASDAAG